MFPLSSLIIAYIKGVGNQMERAKERAKELGRNLLSMAMGGSAEDEGERGEAKRRSWSDVVSNSPSPSNCPKGNARRDVRAEVGMPQPSAPAKHVRSSPGRENSSQKIFSVDDVAKLVEIARNQLRKEQEMNSGWKEVSSRDSRNKEKSYARELVEGYRSSPESPFKYWQCNIPGHKSADCSKGERCFTCNIPSHKRADCPTRRKATRKEKGKALEVEVIPRRRTTIGIHIGDQRPITVKDKEFSTQHLQPSYEAATKEKGKPVAKEWRKIPSSDAEEKVRPGRQNEDDAEDMRLGKRSRPGRHHVDGSMDMVTHRPGRQTADLQTNRVTINAERTLK